MADNGRKEGEGGTLWRERGVEAGSKRKERAKEGERVEEEREGRRGGGSECEREGRREC